MLNKVFLIGNVGSDIEVRYSQSGNAFCSIKLATSSSYVDKQGNKKEDTEWHTITCFGKTAENCGKYLKKGNKIYVEGKIKTEKVEDREGKAKYYTKIYANEIKFLSSKNIETQEKDEYIPLDDIPF